MAASRIEPTNFQSVVLLWIRPSRNPREMQRWTETKNSNPYFYFMLHSLPEGFAIAANINIYNLIMQSFFYQIANSKIFEKSAQKVANAFWCRRSLRPTTTLAFKSCSLRCLSHTKEKQDKQHLGERVKKQECIFKMNTFWLLSSKLKYWMQTTDGYDLVWWTWAAVVAQR